MRKEGIQFNEKIKIALVSDFLMELGGAERVFFELADIFPQADLYTLLYDKGLTDKFLKGRNINASILNKLPFFLKNKKHIFLPFYPSFIEGFDFSKYDLVISSSSIFSKGVITQPQTTHISYIHAVSRFLWEDRISYLLKRFKFNPFLPALKYILHRLRIWDFISSKRVDVFVANSFYTKQAIKKIYKKDALVLYPPVKKPLCKDVNFYRKKDYFLIISRLSAYKNIDLFVRVFNKMELPLVVVGDGKEYKRLKKIAGKNIEFVGFVQDECLGCFIKNARAVIVPAKEDFGIVGVEAMFYGKPVLTYKGGGNIEWMEEGKTGEFFEYYLPEIIADGVRKINSNSYDKEYIKAKAQLFSEERFKKEFEKLLASILKNKNN